jgi:hypothetical protein
MAKIVSFTKSLNQTRECALDGFVDDGDLLEFSRSETAQPQTNMRHTDQSTHPTSIFATDWTNQELADLYRAHSLIQSAQPGLECDRGVSDEGDPWFLIGDQKGDVLVHICRIQGTYILDSVALPKALKGANFNALIEDFLANVTGDHAQDAEDAEADNSPTNVVRLARGGTVCLHPSMMLAALVWTLLMNADELTLPPANGSSHMSLGANLDQGQHRDSSDQDKAQDGTPADNDVASNEVWLDMPAAAKAGLMKLESVASEGNNVSSDLSTKTMTVQLAQRDEKQMHVSACSHALTTIAIAAGFYASAEAANVFWKSTNAPSDISVAFGETKSSETSSDQVTPLDHLSDALALLSNVVDLVVFASHEDYAAESRGTEGESADALTPSALVEALEASIGQQMLTMASEVVKNLAEASHTKTVDTSGQALKAAFEFEAANAVQSDMAEAPYNKSLALNAKEEASVASIEYLAKSYASSDLDVKHYATTSFNAGIGKFDGELEKYSKALELESASFPIEVESAGASGGDDHMPPLESTYLNAFDDAARSFINSKIANADLEIIVFEREILYVDKAAFSNDNTMISWQLDDGGLVSMIGLSSDMAEFLVA